MIECSVGLECIEVVTMESPDGPKPVRQPAAFDGTVEEAEVQGWEETEYGFTCPACRTDNYGDDENAAAALAGSESESEDLGQLMIAAAALSEVEPDEGE